MRRFPVAPGDDRRVGSPATRSGGRPIVLTVNGKSEAVVQSAEAYQRLLDIAALADARQGIRQGLTDMHQGKVRPAREFLEEMRARHGIRR